MGRKPKITNEQCAEALRNSGGFISHAAKQLDVSPTAVAKRIDKSEELQRIIKETQGTYLDLAETQLIKAIKDREPWAICFYLKCKGKERGYIERQILDVNAKVTGGVLVVPGKIEAAEWDQKAIDIQSSEDK